MNQPWYKIQHEAQLDSPALLLYKERVEQNIQRMIAMAGTPDKLMVHVKTTKMQEVVKMLLEVGISRFKCATIAEAELVCMAGGQYLILAHQLVGPKLERLIRLRQAYPHVFMASLVDCREEAARHQQAFSNAGLVADVFLDVNNGMDRSGHPLNEEILPLYEYLHQLPGLHCHGLHVYDGHWRHSDFDQRRQQVDEGFRDVEALIEAVVQKGMPKPVVVAGGTPTFTSHLMRAETYCSPGTCVLWDWGYGEKLSEQAFDYAALLFTRIISKPKEGIVTIDLGHKGVAAENPVDKRVRFLNLEGYELLSQSEEHGVLQVSNWESLNVGDVLYGVPYHICPTVNLYEEVDVVQNSSVTDRWQVLARRRRITI